MVGVQCCSLGYKIVKGTLNSYTYKLTWSSSVPVDILRFFYPIYGDFSTQYFKYKVRSSLHFKISSAFRKYSNLLTFCTLLHYSLILECIKSVFFLINLLTIRDNKKAKTGFQKCLPITGKCTKTHLQPVDSQLLEVKH
jgi:hypothetical protein